MTKLLKLIAIGALASLPGSALYAQDIAGDWQATLHAGPAEFRLNLHILKARNGGLTATLDSVDQGANGIPVSSIALEASNLKFTVDAVRGAYEGTVNADGTAIAGTWDQGQPLPLEFHRGIVKLPEHKPGKPSDIDGTWSGTLNMGGGSLRIVFHIVNTEDGLTATADSPDQGAAGMPVSAVTRDGASLKLDLKAVGATFAGTISPDLTTVAGAFTQVGNETPLTLKRMP